LQIASILGTRRKLVNEWIVLICSTTLHRLQAGQSIENGQREPSPKNYEPLFQESVCETSFAWYLSLKQESMGSRW
jgi:hypothetical protein